MGIIQCKKCGVNHDYYDTNRLKTISYYSCRVHKIENNKCIECENVNGNCKHDWRYGFKI
jgi:hypothetical protein